MAIEIDVASRNAMVAAHTALFDAGAAAGRLFIFTGAMPTNITDADPAGTLINMPLGDPAFGTPSNGTGAANAIASALATAGGTAASYRIKDSNSVVREQGTVGEAGSGADMIFDETTWNSGDTITITSWSQTQPAE